jgi:hypothetical protein
MTTTRTTTETLSSPPPVRSPRAILTAAGLAVFAAVAFTPWLLITNSQTEIGPITPASGAASQQAAPAQRQASAGSSADSVDFSAGYALFCGNSPSLCASPAPTLPEPGYVQFCWNSPVLCTGVERD